MRGDLWAATLVLVPGLGASWSSVPSLVPPPAPVPAQRRPPTWLAPASILALMGPPLAPGFLYSPPSLEVPREAGGFSETPPGALSLVPNRGRGACGRSSCINMGAGEGLLRSHLESLLMTLIRAAFSSLEPLVVSPKVRQGLMRGKTGQPGGPGQAEPTADQGSPALSPR